MSFIPVLLLVSLLTLNWCCVPCMAASITASSSDSGTYNVLGVGMTGVAGIEINLGYDSASLMTPSVTQGGLVSGAMMMANTSIPGSIRIAIVKQSPFFGSGQIATVSFAVHNGSDGVTSISARLIDINKVNVPVQVSIVSSPDAQINPPANQPAVSQSVQASAGTTNSGTAETVVLGTVSMQSDNQSKNESKPSEPLVKASTPESVPNQTDTPSILRELAEETAVPSVKPKSPKLISYDSILERFKAYQGERSPAAMMALFKKPVAPLLRQEPAIAVSDGITRVKIFIDLPKNAGSSPVFNLSGVEVISVSHNDETGSLLIEVLPKINGTKASVTLIAENSTLTVPLIIVPPIVKFSIKEIAFADFLKDSGVKKHRFDLNNDGFHDYIDDYIYTGHFLINTSDARNKAR